MAVTIADATRIFGALSLALLLSVSLPEMPGETEANISDGAALAAVLDALSNSDLDEEAKAAAQKVGPGAAGDTCFMRYAGLPFSTDRTTRERFARAAAQTDPDRKIAALEELAVSGQPHQTWRARYAQVIVALRTGDAKQAEGFLRLAAEVPGMPPECRADESYVSALITDAPDVSLDALLKAFDQDRGSWAIASALALRLPEAAEAGMGCRRAASHLIRVVVQLSHLTQSDSQLARLSRAVTVDAGKPESDSKILRSLLVGMIQERSNRLEAARATYLEGQSLARARLACGPELPDFFENRSVKLQEKTAP